MKSRDTANRSFPDTRWSLIAKVREGSERERALALEELCKSYWPPIYAFVRFKGATSHEAEDLTQGFFADFLARGDFAKPSEESGRLRSYMLGAVKNFMSNDWRSRQTQKRGGGIEFASLDVTYEHSLDRIIEPTEKDTPESIFDRQWALTVLHSVIQSLGRRYEEKGQGPLFDKLKFIIASGASGQTYAEIASELGMSESAVKVAAHRLKERYAALLHETISDTLAEGEDVGEEMLALMKCF